MLTELWLLLLLLLLKCSDLGSRHYSLMTTEWTVERCWSCSIRLLQGRCCCRCEWRWENKQQQHWWRCTAMSENASESTFQRKTSALPSMMMSQSYSVITAAKYDDVTVIQCHNSWCHCYMLTLSLMSNHTACLGWSQTCISQSVLYMCRVYLCRWMLPVFVVRWRGKI